MKCPKCNSEMEEGMTVEYKSPGGFEINVNLPKKETWGKTFKPGFFVDSVERELPITSYRCTSCGYIESYAK